MSTVEFDQNFTLLRMFCWGISPKKIISSNFSANNPVSRA